MEKISNPEEAAKVLKELVLTMETLEQFFKLSRLIEDFKIGGGIFFIVDENGDGGEFDYIMVNEEMYAIDFMIKSKDTQQASDKIYCRMGLNEAIGISAQMSYELCEITVHFPESTRILIALVI